MKKFFKVISFGLVNILISLSAIVTFVVSVLAFMEIPKLTGFVVLGVMFSGLCAFIFGVYFVYTLGDAVNNSREYIKQQEEASK